MKSAADFRSIAKNALRDKWSLALLAGLLASLLGAIASYFPQFSFSISDDSIYALFDLELSDQLTAIIIGICLAIISIALVIGIVRFILGSIILVGYDQFNLDWIDGQKAPTIGTLFGFFKNWKTVIAAMFLLKLYVFLWTLLFIIPGIIASYSYAMTGYILAEHPELTASEALKQSKQMMSGNRGRLFCLQLSFIGWDLLCSFTLGIGNLWLVPYKQAATAAFYREVSGTEYVASEETDQTI